MNDPFAQDVRRMSLTVEGEKLDGNKRTALGACLVFLRLNGLEPSPDGSDWETLTLAVASGELGREETAARLRRLVNA